MGPGPRGLEDVPRSHGKTGLILQAYTLVNTKSRPGPNPRAGSQRGLSGRFQTSNNLLCRIHFLSARWRVGGPKYSLRRDMASAQNVCTPVLVHHAISKSPLKRPFHESGGLFARNSHCRLRWSKSSLQPHPDLSDSRQMSPAHLDG